MTTKERGDQGEEKAVHYLKEKNYRILDRNFHTSYGEIDIVAVVEEILVFVEVKARKNDDYGYPSEFVTKGKQKRIMNSAQVYMLKNEMSDRQMRFDVIEYYIQEDRLHHIVDAFP